MFIDPFIRETTPAVTMIMTPTAITISIMVKPCSLCRFCLLIFSLEVVRFLRYVVAVSVVIQVTNADEFLRFVSVWTIAKRDLHLLEQWVQIRDENLAVDAGTGP